MHNSRRLFLQAGLALGAAGALGACGRPEPATPEPAAGPVLAVVGATVIDAARPVPLRNATVLISGDRILDVGPAAEVAVPSGATVVDATGKFVIPGLADMHVHSVPLERTFPPLFLANGVTTVREMGGNPEAGAFRDRVQACTAFGPRSAVASTIIDGSPSLWEGIGVPFTAVADAAQAREAVRTAKAARADFVKIYTRLSRASFDAIADEARLLDIPFLGHCPDFVPITDASDAGMRTIEHLWQFWYSTSKRESRLRRAVSAVPIAGGEYGGWYSKMHPTEYDAARSVDPAKAADLFARLAANGTFVTPTLTQHQVVDVPSSADRDNPNLAYLPRPYADSWKGQMEQIYLQGRSRRQDAERAELYERRLGLVPTLAAAGVPLLAGTDTGTAYVLPGFALHEELRLLVRAGLSPIQALRAATLEPARYLGLEADLGTVDRGKIADLVILDADPLIKIDNTSRIDSVIVRGCLLDPAARRRIFDDIRAAAEDPASAGVKPARCACGAGT